MSGCLFYDYGIDKKKNNLPYRTYYYSETNKKHDFTTVLFSSKNGPSNYNYAGFTISISHMHKTNQKRHKGKYVSQIRFDTSPDSKIQILSDSIILKHKTNTGTKIPHEQIENTIPKKSIEKHGTGYYIKIYNPLDLPKEIIEYIYIEVIINGEKEIIEYTLPIKKALHYTWWDVIMGV